MTRKYSLKPKIRKCFLGLFAVLIIFTTSCRELVQSEFSQIEPIPVINAVLIPDSSIHVHISQATSLNTDSIKWLEDASVVFYEDNIYLETLKYKGYGLYRGDSFVKENKSYLCEIDIPEMGFYSCSTHVPVAEKIIDFNLIEQANKHEEGFTYPSLEVLFSNSPNQKKYFDVKIILYQGDYVSEGVILDHTDPVLLNEGFPLSLFSNDIIDDTLYNIIINFTTGSIGSSNGSALKTELYPMIVELRSVNESYYKYAKQLHLYNSGRYPEFSLTSIDAYPLYSNIDNAFGIFTSYSANTTDTIYP